MAAPSAATRARARPPRRGGAAGRIWTRIVFYAVFVVATVWSLYPLVWLVTNSFKTPFELFTRTWALPKKLIWQNYVQAWDFGISQYLLNSIVVTAAAVVITITISLLAAYALARFEFPGRRLLFYFILGGLMLAPEVSLIPLFRILTWLGLYNTYWAMILPDVAFGIPFSTFLIRAYLLGLPRELEDAGRIDGASYLRVLWHIVIPLSRPILISAAMVQAMQVWNEFLFALTFVTSERYKTLTIGVMSFVSALKTNWAVVIAALVISALPMIVLFLLAQRFFIRGLTAGGLKG